ncbi:hypothetical protein [Streptomyces chartreusis]|uniref:hypothetical protein n=1 Tax=Streptomyces chartreusis TaxID=1969 RepID=UPI00365C0D66
MRRPAQTHHRPAAHTPRWAHPYTGIQAMAVLYADGGEPTPPPAPPAAEPPKPGPPPAPAPTYTQDELSRIAAREKSQGERAGARKALEDFASEHGFGSVDDAKAFIEAARKAEQDALSEHERAQQRLKQDQDAVNAERAQIAAERRALAREQALARLGAVDLTGEDGQVTPNLQDALAMLERDLRDTPDADDQTVADTAARLKQRRPELFGATPPPGVPPQMPPAPGGAPAGGPPSRQTPSAKPGNRGLEMARLRGHARSTT